MLLKEKPIKVRHDNPNELSLKTKMKMDKVIHNVLNNPDTDLIRELQNVGYKKNVNVHHREKYKNYLSKRLSEFGITKEGIIKRFEVISDKAMDKDDFSNALRGTEDIAKVCGVMKENNQTNVIMFSDDMISSLSEIAKNRQIIDQENEKLT
jgi:hypothetical protein